MKRKFLHIGKSSLSVLLSIMMLFSSVIVGSSVTVDTQESGAIINEQSSGSSVSTGAIIYFKHSPSAYPNWASDGVVNVWVFPDGGSGVWADVHTNTGLTDSSGNAVDYFIVPSGTWDKFIIVCSTDGSDPWGTKKRQTSNLDFSTTNYLRNYSTDASRTYWDSSIVFDTTATITPSESTVNAGQAVTFTPALADTTYNDITSNSFSVSPSVNVNNIDNDSRTIIFPNDTDSAITYTITDTVTYNARGFSSATKTATASTTVVVEPNTTTYTNVSIKAQYTTDGTKYNDATVSGLTINGGTEPVTVAGGNSVSVFAPATASINGSNYKFVGWTSTGSGTFVNGTSNSATYSPNATGENAVALYNKIYTVTCASATNGTITVNNNSSASLGVGESYTVTVAPDSGYSLVSLKAGTTDVTSQVSNDAYIGTVTGDVTFTATFEKDEKWYVMGGFNKSGSTTAWNDSNLISDYKFTPVPGRDYLYKYSTGMTLNDLKTKTNPYYFFAKSLNNQTTLYHSSELQNSGANFKFNGSDSGTTVSLTESTTYNFAFIDTNNTSSDEVTFWINTSDPDDPYFYYTLAGDTTEYQNGLVIDPNKDYIYFERNTYGNWSPPYVYAFNTNSNNTWPGTKMKKVSGESNLYALEIDSTFSSYTQIILHDNTKGQDGVSNGIPRNQNHRSVTIPFDSAVNKNQVWTPNSGYKQETYDNGEHYCRTGDWHDPIPDIGNAKTRIYAKSGTIRNDFEKYSLLAGVDVTCTGTAGTDYNKYKYRTYSYNSNYYDKVQIVDIAENKNVSVTVTVTLHSAYKDKYYVRGFCVNGDTEKYYTEKTSNGKYTYTFTPDGSQKYIEITPIYYYVEDNPRDYITFEVEAFSGEVKDQWGDTIACQAWYYGGEEKAEAAAANKNALGGYPGQPLIKIGAVYYMQVPKNLNNLNNQPIKGITLNNYCWDDIHNEIGEALMPLGNFKFTGKRSKYSSSYETDRTKRNCQTYDYDDFVAISKLLEKQKQVITKRIIFNFKYRTYNSIDCNPNSGNVPPKNANNNNLDFVVPIFDDTNGNRIGGGNGWETLVDFYDVPVDIFATRIDNNNTYTNKHIAKSSSEAYLDSEAIKNDALVDAVNKLYVVSDGYENYYADETKNENGKAYVEGGNAKKNEYIGEYATLWYVYTRNAKDGTFNFIGSLPPSAFLCDCVKSDGTLDETKFRTYSTAAQHYGGSRASFSTFKKIYDTYKDWPVVITYESAIFDNGRQGTENNLTGDSDAASNYGYRCDGRWYYSKIGQKINANVEIQIVSTDENGNVTIVTPKDDFKTNTVHTGTITNANAYFTNSGFSGEVESGKISEDGSKNFTLTADSSSVAVNGDTYVFRGWYLRVGDYDYTPLNSSNNLYSTTATSPMSSSGTFVARYEKIESKTLVISHQLYSTADRSDDDPDVYGGTGKTYVSVTIYDADDNYVTEYQETEGSRTISNAAHLQSGYKIVVTLRTEPDTGSTMENMYHKNDTYDTPATGYKDITNSDSDDKTTQTITYYVNDLFPEGVTARTIKEYSNLSTSNIVVRFKYYDRKTDGQSIPMTVDTNPTTITVNTALDSTRTGNAEKLDNTVLDAYNAKVNGKVGTALDDYFFRTNQSTAVNDFGNKVDLHATYAKFDSEKEYTEVSYNDNIDAENENTIKYDLNKHFDYFGNACMKKAYKSESNYAFQESYNADSKSVDDWVTYRDSNNQVITFDEAKANPKRVASITVWGYNTPKVYNLYFTAATSNSGFKAEADFTNSSNQAVYIPSTNYIIYDFTGYYNERVGRASYGEGNENIDDVSPHLKAYGITTALHNGIRKDITTVKSVTVGNDTYTFDGWYDTNNVKVSSDLTYANRIVTDLTLIAGYVKNSTTVSTGITVSENSSEKYVDSNGNARVRLLTQVNAYGYPDEDKDIKDIAIIYIKMPADTVLDESSVDYAALKNDLLSSITNSNSSTKRYYIFTVNVNNISSNGITYTYDVNWGWLDTPPTAAGTKEVQLTNKNRMQFSLDLSQASVAEGGANSRILVAAAINHTKSETDSTLEWKLSDNMLAYVNGTVEYNYIAVQTPAANPTSGGGNNLLNAVSQGQEPQISGVYNEE